MVYKHGDAGARLPPMEDCSTYLVCNGGSIIVIIGILLLNVWYLALLLYVRIYTYLVY